MIGMEMKIAMIQIVQDTLPVMPLGVVLEAEADLEADRKKLFVFRKSCIFRKST